MKRELVTQAEQMAQDNPPGVVLENLLLGIFRVLGFILGRLWFYGSKIVYIIGLALADGYKQGARAMVQPQATQPIAVPAGAFVEDPRIHDTAQTPFGVPYGPNIQASHD
jgi:hypothetical protein